MIFFFFFSFIRGFSRNKDERSDKKGSRIILAMIGGFWERRDENWHGSVRLSLLFGLFAGFIVGGIYLGGELRCCLISFISGVLFGGRPVSH